jgi:hypothetical protein
MKSPYYKINTASPYCHKRKETEEHRARETCPNSQSWYVGKQDLKSGNPAVFKHTLTASLPLMLRYFYWDLLDLH